ncbi:hypothetical protein FA95DRAFT_1028509 [Auriscalpium vulgare]|uniref:Uncharacterized protein n=1 Tax=Auriscalpium vulgare TaxID=40419 RepID=A0ACB8R6Z3_9AGAM|nr:hypothetical protein FA95DRAFT_1028509 [Auriscalpium vulgare]
MDMYLTPQSDMPALSDLEVRLPLDTDWCQRLSASGVLPQIRTLRITKGFIMPSEVVGQFGRLESLVFDYLPYWHITLPKTLRHIGYHSSKGSDTAEQATFLWAVLPSLQGLQLVTCTRRSSPSLLAAFDVSCRNIHVEFATYETPSHFPVSKLHRVHCD